MRSRDEFDPRRDEGTRLVAVALAAVLVGAMFGPGVAAAASGAWVRISNWPKTQKVTVTNASSAPVYAQPPAHEIVNLHGSGAILSAGSSILQTFYTVPSNKWLVITSMRAEGSGFSPLTEVALSTYGSAIHETFPSDTHVDNGAYNLTSVVPGTEYVPPGTVLYFSAVRATSGTGPWNIGIWVDGYLTDRP